MTFAELKTMLQALGYGTDSDIAQGLFINEAYRRVARRRAWSWLRAGAVAAMIPGVMEYDWTSFTYQPGGPGSGSLAAAPPRRLESARLIDVTVNPSEVLPLRWLEPAAFNDARGSTSTSWGASEREVPTYWTRPSGAGVAIWRPPDLAYGLHINFIAPASTLSGVQVPLMPSDYHDVLVYEAAYLMATRQRDQIAMNEFRAERDAVLAQLEAEDSVAQSRDYERIGGKDIWRSLEVS